MNDGYCDNCKKKVPVWIRSRDATIRYNNRTMTYDEAYAVCQFCGREAHDLNVEEMNTKRRACALSANETRPFMKQNKKRHAKTSM